jgi:hypothetical protein
MATNVVGRRPEEEDDVHSALVDELSSSAARRSASTLSISPRLLLSRSWRRWPDDEPGLFDDDDVDERAPPYW